MIQTQIKPQLESPIEPQIKPQETSSIPVSQESPSEIYTIPVIYENTESPIQNIITGTPKADTLMGTDNDDIFDGKKGNDLLIGGKGNDTYVFPLYGFDTIQEKANEGIDTVQVRKNYTLPPHVENIESNGKYGPRIYGNNLNNIFRDGDYRAALYGKEGDDIFYGNGGNDKIHGGDGIDTMIFSGLFTEYTLSPKGRTSYTIVDSVKNRDDTDTFSFIEKLQFQDGVYDITTKAFETKVFEIKPATNTSL